MREVITRRLNVKRTKQTLKLNQKAIRSTLKVADKVLVRRGGIHRDKRWYPINCCVVINKISDDGRTADLINEDGTVVFTTKVSNIRKSTETSTVYKGL